MGEELVSKIPLWKDAGDVYRVGKTRVALELLVRAFNDGITAEGIVEKYPGLDLCDVYQVIGYYLRHSGEFTGYLEKREREERERHENHLEDESPAGIRERLHARRTSGELPADTAAKTVISL